MQKIAKKIPKKYQNAGLKVTYKVCFKFKEIMTILAILFGLAIMAGSAGQFSHPSGMGGHRSYLVRMTNI